MIVREASGADLSSICRLRLAFLAAYRGLEASQLAEDFVESTGRYIEIASIAGSLRSWLAEEDEVAGTVSLLLIDVPPLPEDARAREGYVLNTYVDPGHRRRGIGRSLMERCRQGASELGCRRMFLWATAEGRPRYLEAGFVAHEDWMELRL